MRLAYSFEDSGRPRHMHRGFSDEPGQQQLQEVVREWNHIWHGARPLLQVRDQDNRLHFFDTRPCAKQTSWSVEGLEADVYRLCDSAQTPVALNHQLRARRGAEFSMQEMETSIDSLLNANVMLRLNGKLLAIGVNPQELAQQCN